MSIINALRDVRASLMAGEPVGEAFRDAAEDNGVNPVLLRRKYAENYGNPEQLFASTSRARDISAKAQKQQVEVANAVRDALQFSW